MGMGMGVGMVNDVAAFTSWTGVLGKIAAVAEACVSHEHVLELDETRF
jgi:hypothetical protein